MQSLEKNFIQFPTLGKEDSLFKNLTWPSSVGKIVDFFGGLEKMHK